MNEQKPTILMADDNDLAREVISDCLTIAGIEHDVITASSGEEALERIRQGGLDLAILDGSFGYGMKGDEVARLVRKEYPELPIVIQSMEPEKYQGVAKEITGVRVFSKFDREDIIKYVKDMLSGQTPEIEDNKRSNFEYS